MRVSPADWYTLSRVFTVFLLTDLAKVHLSAKRYALILKWSLIFNSFCAFLKVKILHKRKQVSLSGKKSFYLLLSFTEATCLRPILKELVMEQSPLCLFLSLGASFSPYWKTSQSLLHHHPPRKRKKKPIQIFLDMLILISATLYLRKQQFLFCDFFFRLLNIYVAIASIRLTFQCYHTTHHKASTKDWRY